MLVKIQLLGLFGLNKALHADKRKAKKSIALFLLAALSIGVICIAYGVGVASSLVQFGLTSYIPVVAVLVGFVVGAISAFTKTNGVLFAFKDYDVIMSLPVKTSTVVLSRLLALYALAILLGALAMLPALCVYLAEVGACIAAVVLSVLSVFLAPLLPMALAILLAVSISALASRMRHANVVTVALSLIVVVALIVVPYATMGSLGFNATDFAALIGQQLTMIESLLPPVAWASEGIAEGNFAAFGLFAAASIIPAVAVVALISHWFSAINSALIGKRSRGTFTFAKDQAEEGSSPLKALVTKEVRRLVATPFYLMNSCIGFVMILVAGLAAVIISSLGMLPESLFADDFRAIIATFLPWVVSFFVGISATTSASISLEGKSRWLMYTAPVSAKTVYSAKVLLDLVLAVPATVIGAVSLAIVFRVDSFAGIMTVMVPLVVCVFVAIFGLAVDARHPHFDWTSEYEPVKRSVAAMLTVLAGFAVMVVGILTTALAGHAGMIAIVVIFGVAAWVLFRQTVSTPLRERPLLHTPNNQVQK